MSRILFVTGTDTHVGKTLLTSLLVVYWRAIGCKVVAMKPFCSGGRGDARLLRKVQGTRIPLAELNPFYFPEPVAPLVAARMHGQRLSLRKVVSKIRGLESRADRLIVEGVGGVLVPLGQRFGVADLIARLSCDVVLVASNKLGVLNHVLLSIEALRARGVGRIQVVLMGQMKPDCSAASNADVLSEMLFPLEVVCLPYLRGDLGKSWGLKENVKKLEKVLARVGDPDSFSALVRVRRCQK